MRISSPSRKINVRKPSHFGSKIQVCPAGNVSIRFASIGSTGGFTGRFTIQSYCREASEIYDWFTERFDSDFNFSRQVLLDDILLETLEDCYYVALFGLRPIKSGDHSGNFHSVRTS